MSSRHTYADDEEPSNGTDGLLAKPIADMRAAVDAEIALLRARINFAEYGLCKLLMWSCVAMSSLTAILVGFVVGGVILLAPMIGAIEAAALMSLPLFVVFLVATVVLRKVRHDLLTAFGLENNSDSDMDIDDD